ncbi:TIGR03013 family XrtA/PEP-CTERM system glycosyltransferase [Methylotuvimicrobium alcaliphilum]|uniref:Undecaprenyl-phosphate galactosephosphotransferase n=1 Tax=Methylotuvimicrobium alcaliphilum (strain DSM 19304 / NCIMB 14124 / VKM B-2133 / 20Z) TaxID=1091494 RepID=G4SZJ0_META2|nr:TIGR03013 family XrtA/PEP-CTERM system glycosyltransferase [Methylotuvimicrobium alcaliphilum]CCE24431.1 Undecaprenyl-phosphate galactosephosphotransferase [Methylotuvimicrobium alcaliphilum 20Z]
MIRIFRHYISSAFLWLLVFEAVIFYFAMYLGSQVRFLYQPSWYSEADIVNASLIFAAIFTLCNISLGLYRRNLGIQEYDLLARVSFSFGVGIFVVVSIYYLFPNFLIARSVLGVSIVFAFLGMMLIRYFFYRYSKIDRIKKQVLVVGSGNKAKELVELNAGYLHKSFNIAGFVALPDELCCIDEALLIKQDKSLNEVAQDLNIDEIVLAIDDRRRGMPLTKLLDCKMSGFDVIDLVTFYERERGIVSLTNVYPSWFLFSDGFAVSGLRSIGKRLFDILVSLILLAVAWPIMLMTSIAILIESGIKAPIFYRQVRVGENNRNFEVIKFRSMVVDAEKNGAQFAQEKDNRITKVGAFIRKCRIDELPQIFNVLTGDMSFVGPRPERPEFVEGFVERIDYYAERHRVKPGITGWAQISYQYGASEDDTVRKLEYDLYYVKNYSLFLDISIILHTIEIVVWGKGAR